MINLLCTNAQQAHRRLFNLSILCIILFCLFSFFSYIYASHLNQNSSAV